MYHVHSKHLCRMSNVYIKFSINFELVATTTTKK